MDEPEKPQTVFERLDEDNTQTVGPQGTVVRLPILGWRRWPAWQKVMAIILGVAVLAFWIFARFIRH